MQGCGILYFLLCVPFPHIYVCITKKGQAITKEGAFLFLRYFPDLIYSTLLSLRLIVELSSSPSTLLALSLAKMIAISCIPSAASCTQRDCLGWPRQMIMNKSELWLITTLQVLLLFISVYSGPFELFPSLDEKYIFKLCFQSRNFVTYIASEMFLPY